MDQSNNSVLYRNVILNTRKPLVFRKFHTNWKCFNLPIEEWCKRFDESIQTQGRTTFEEMPNKFCDFPQFERYRSKLSASLTDFLGNYSKNKDNWAAFYYEPTRKIPIECRYDVDFGCFGFDKNNDDVSFWLSSKGANTPCHYDTYGCNIVVQIYGRKHWLLFPPETSFTPIRVPYEESSVYCSENFFSPKNLDKFSVARENAFQCILEEGDALIVPRNWWHYVESLETSLSINTWIPLKIDIDAQIKECIVKYIMETFMRYESDEKKRYVLNPNQLQLIESSDKLLEILHYLMESKSNDVNEECEKFSYEYLSETEVNKLIESCRDDVTILQKLDSKDFDDIMKARTERYTCVELPDKSDIHPMNEALLNAICHPNSIDKIKEEFLKKIYHDKAT